MRNPNDGKGSRTTPTDPMYAPQRFCNDFYLGASTLSIFLLRARGLSFGSNVCVVLWAVFALALLTPQMLQIVFPFLRRSLLQLKRATHTGNWGTATSSDGAGKHQ